MRLDSIFDSFYVVGSLWTATTGSQVCTANRPVRPPAGVTAFVGVNVVPMDTERVLSNQTVVVERGRIMALGPAGQVQVPAGAVRVDGRGKYLMPGLTDMHYGPSHRISAPREGEEQPFADGLFLGYSAYGVTAVRSLGITEGEGGRSRRTSGKSSRGAVQQRLRQIVEEFPVPRLYFPFRAQEISSTAADSLAAALADAKAAGYSHFVASGISDSLLRAFRRAGLPMVTHGHGLSWPLALQLGLAGGSVEHLYVFWDSLLGKPGPAGTMDDMSWNQPPLDLPMAKVPGMAAALRRAGVWVTPTLNCMEKVHRHIQGNALARIVKTMQDSSVKMLLGSDGQALSGSVHNELVTLVQAGLTPYQALLTGTRNVAEYFHLLDSAGTVAVGKRADLVLLNGNPLQDIRQTWEPAGVMLRGQWFDRVALDQRLMASPTFLTTQMMFVMPAFFERRFWKTMSWALAEPGVPLRTDAQWEELNQRGQQVIALDSALRRSQGQQHRDVLLRMATELGAIRATLTSEQREGFDANLRVWLREHARQGRRVVITGIAPVS